MPEVMEIKNDIHTKYSSPLAWFWATNYMPKRENAQRDDKGAELMQLTVQDRSAGHSTTAGTTTIPGATTLDAASLDDHGRSLILVNHARGIRADPQVR